MKAHATQMENRRFKLLMKNQFRKYKGKKFRLYHQMLSKTQECFWTTNRKREALKHPPKNLKENQERIR